MLRTLWMEWSVANLGSIRMPWLCIEGGYFRSIYRLVSSNSHFSLSHMSEKIFGQKQHSEKYQTIYILTLGFGGNMARNGQRLVFSYIICIKLRFSLLKGDARATCVPLLIRA